MRVKSMFKIMIGLICSLMLTANSYSEVVVANNPLSGTLGGQADAFSSNGAYNNGYGLAGAQAFSMEDSHTLSSLEWWGSPYWAYIGDAPGLSNISGFEIVVWDSTFTNKVIDTTVSLANLTITNTGEESFYGESIYKFRSEFTFNLSAGDYYMNIGAQLVDGNSPYYWLWSQGEYSDTGYWITSGNNLSHPWGDWTLPQWIAGGPGGAFVMNAPTPGAIGLLAMAGLLGSRRRR